MENLVRLPEAICNRTLRGLLSGHPLGFTCTSESFNARVASIVNLCIWNFLGLDESETALGA